jgi:hypothetical protein
MIYDHMNSRFLSEEGILNVVLAFIESEAGTFVDYVEEDGNKRRRRKRTSFNVNDEVSLWNTPWGLMLTDEELRDNKSRASKKFRRRFRIPYPLFLHLVERCKEAGLFGTPKIPEEFRSESTPLVNAYADETHLPFMKMPTFLE